MRNVPLAARIYIWSVVAAGTFVLGLFGREFYTMAIAGKPDASTNICWFFMGCLVSFASSFLNIKVFIPGKSKNGHDSKGNISLGFVPTFFLLFGLGPFYAIVASMVNVLTMTCYPRRSPYFQVLFSLGAIVLSVAGAAEVLSLCGFDWHRSSFVMLDPNLDSRRLVLETFGIGAATTVYSLSNTFLVATAIGLTGKKNILGVWRKHYQWLLPCYYAGASCATISICLAPLLAEHFLASFIVALIAAPMPGVIFLVYRYHRTQEESRILHIEELQRNNAELERSRVDLSRTNTELESLYTSTVESLALAIDAKDRYTKEHIQRVKEVAVRIAIRLGLEGNELRAVETGALLHDIGKLAIPEYILSKPGKLTPDEFEKVKCHPEMGARILEPVHFPFPVMPIVRGHHERWDGKGYPDGLEGEAIPLGARILAVADVYDALTSDRPYRSGWTRERAVEHICASAGEHFDARVVAAFLAVSREDVAAEEAKKSMEALVVIEPIPPAPVVVQINVADEINRANFESLSLFEIAQAATATLELPETLELLISKLRLLFKASCCVLMLVENPMEKNGEGRSLSTLRCTAACGDGEEIFAHASAQIGTGSTIGGTERAMRTRQGQRGVYEPDDLLFEGVAEDEEGAQRLAALRSALIVPLATSDVTPLLGTINLYHERPDAFSLEDQRVLQTVSVQVARAIANAHEFDYTRRSAITDALTGLYNARYMSDFLDRELTLARDEELPLTVLVLDLDGFKKVNDRFGHARGNEVLRDLGWGFQSILRSGDLVARYAGDEFVIVLPGVDSRAAWSVMEKVRAVTQSYDGRPLHVPAGTRGAAITRKPSPTSALEEDSLGGLRIGISIGIACYPRDADDTAALIARADRDMYRDKSARKDAEEKAVRQLLADVRSK